MPLETGSRIGPYEISPRIGEGGMGEVYRAVDEAVPIAIQIAEALETAHDQGIIHRDLKPASAQPATAS